MNDIVKKIYQLGILPVVKLHNPDDSIPLAKSLINGGLPCAEITFRTDAAEESINMLSKKFPEMFIGAGTVLNINQAEKAISAGAKFIVSPGLNEEVVKYCISRNIQIFPGVSTPSEVEKAMSLGLKILKFFPAEQSGGISMVKALCGPYTDVKFIPTGGINEKNLNDYLSFDKVVACGGSWMVKDFLIREGRFDEISQLVKSAVSKIHEFEIMHVGINNDNEEIALAEAKKLSKLFDMPVNKGQISTYTGSIVEFMHKKHYGHKGHIGIGVNSVDRAYAYLISRGYEFIEDSIIYDDSGKKTLAYLKGEFGGFAVHIVNK